MNGGKANGNQSKIRKIKNKHGKWTTGYENKMKIKVNSRKLGIRIDNKNKDKRENEKQE